MVKTSSTEKTHVKKGSWSPEEDRKLAAYIKRYGIWNWSEMSKAAGLARTGKSCRLRWVNYLRPDIKRGNFSKDEEETIMTLHETLGNRWSAIAERLPGRTDNEVKNYWNGHLKKRLIDSSTSTVLAYIQVADNEASLKNPELDQPSLQPGDSISKLEGISAINTTVVSPQLQITSSVPTNCEIGKDQNNIVDEGFNYTDNTSSETLIEELQSLWSADQQPVPVGNGEFFDPQIRGSSSTCTSQLWPQDPTWPYDFYKEYDDCYDWVDYGDKTFGKWWNLI